MGYFGEQDRSGSYRAYVSAGKRFDDHCDSSHLQSEKRMDAWDGCSKKEVATATKMQRWAAKSYQCSSSGPWSHLTSQAATSPSYESSEWAKATAYWEKTTAQSQELSSSLLRLTHKLQVHTSNLKITLLLEFKGSKLKISQASLQ